MDAIERADGILSSVRARRPGACLPGSAPSPADRLGTLSLTHEFIAECDRAARRETELEKLAHRRTEPDDNDPQFDRRHA